MKELESSLEAAKHDQQEAEVENERVNDLNDQLHQQLLNVKRLTDELPAQHIQCQYHAYPSSSRHSVSPVRVVSWDAHQLDD